MSHSVNNTVIGPSCRSGVIPRGYERVYPAKHGWKWGNFFQTWTGKLPFLRIACLSHPLMETHSFKRNLIIAADDDEDDIDLMRLLFRKAGISQPVEVFRRGEDIIEALTAMMTKSIQAVMPFLCFLDVKMPTVSGHELLRWIRSHPQFDGLAVVMLSSSEHPDDVKRAADNGAQCYLAKYPDPTVLKRVVDEAERMSMNGVQACKEWFGLPANLLLRRSLSGGAGPAI